MSRRLCFGLLSFYVLGALAACHHQRQAAKPGETPSAINDVAPPNGNGAYWTQPTARAKREERLTAFANKEELVAFLRKQKLIVPNNQAASGSNMWGDAIGDAFGAGGLGLSGIGEGGGGNNAGGAGSGVGSVGTLGHGSGTAAGSGAGAGISATGNMWGNSATSTLSITNTQHANVDEGDIVKMHGEHLVVLRRGRIFTIRANDLSLVSRADAFGPGIDPAGAWYDEMLVHAGKIIVIGYSYARGGTEVGLFDIDAAGNIEHRSTYQLRSNDYYSSRNYASRLIGDKLVFYAPLYVQGTEKSPLSWLPALRRWKPGVTDAAFNAIVEPARVYRPLTPMAPSSQLTLHAVTVCDLSKRDVTCDGRGVMGPPGRVFYVSPTAVYVWMTPEEPKMVTTSQGATAAIAPDAIVHRLPLDGSTPTVIGARGGPVDQFSFLEQDGQLNVMLRADTGGDEMTSPEDTSGEAALLRVPLSRFTNTLSDVPVSSYRRLPTPKGETMQNRFIGEWLVYGTGTSWSRPRSADDGRVFVQRIGSKEPTTAITIGHGVDRIEPMGGDAVVVGADAHDLHFSPIALSSLGSTSTRRPAMGVRYTRRGAAQGELRSHGFFYRPDGAQKGLFGLPVRAGGSPGYAHLEHDSASVQFVRNDGLVLHDVGALDAKNGAATANDACRASCVDWYGNARPLFFGDRVLALLGYEIVEGRLDPARGINEVRRASFAPSSSATFRR